MSESLERLYSRLGEAFKGGELPRTALRGYGLADDGITVYLRHDDLALRQALAELSPAREIRVVVGSPVDEQAHEDDLPHRQGWRVRARSHRQRD